METILGGKLAMRVMQSDLYHKLDEAERGECDALIHAFQAQLRRGTCNACTDHDVCVAMRACVGSAI